MVIFFFFGGGFSGHLNKEGSAVKGDIFHGGHLFFRLEEWWNYQKIQTCKKHQDFSIFIVVVDFFENVYGASYWE